MVKKHKSVDHSKMKLGSHPPKKDDRNFQLNTYLHHEALPPIPHEWNWGEKIPPHRWGAMCNMKLENCTCAAAGHFIMTWTVNTGDLFKPSDKAILKAYSAITGYNPKTKVFTFISDGVEEKIPYHKMYSLAATANSGIDKDWFSAFEKYNRSEGANNEAPKPKEKKVGFLGSLINIGKKAYEASKQKSKTPVYKGLDKEGNPIFE